MADSYTTFEVEIADKVAHLRLNRPDEFNSMTREFWSELPSAIRSLDEDGSVRVIVISSTGKHFCSGMDLGVFASGGGAMGGAASDGKPLEEGRVRARLRQSVKVLQDTFTSIEQARVPVIAAIQGGCIGGAVDMVSACDLRYATENAFFCIQEINLGMTADVGTLQRLPKIIPYGVALEWAYRGHRVPAARAAEVGLVNQVFADHDSLVEGAMEIANEIAAKSPLAIWGTKEMARYTRDHSVADSLEHMAAWQSGMFQPADMMETFVAKGDKRDPDFDDLLPNSRGL